MKRMVTVIFYGRTELRAGWRLVVFIAIIAAITVAGNRIIAAAFHSLGADVMFLMREAMDVAVVIFATWIMARIEKRTFADYGIPWRQAFRNRFWQGILTGLASVTVLIAAMWLCGVLSFGAVALAGAGIVGWAAAWCAIFVIVALKEELRARGYALQTLASGMGFWPAAVVMSAFFGFSHHLNPGENLIGLVNAGLFGMVASFALKRTGDLWFTIGMHVSFDWAETYLYGVANSGNVLPGHVLTSIISGPAWLSGGTVGPEGSVLCTCSLLVTWMICAVLLRRERLCERSVEQKLGMTV